MAYTPMTIVCMGAVGLEPTCATAGVLQTLAHSSRQRAQVTDPIIVIVAFHERTPFFEIVGSQGSRWDSNPRPTGPQPAA